MITWIFIYVIVIIFETVKTNNADVSDMNITEIIKNYGYPLEVHEVETEDGYLLDMYRIPAGRRGRTNRRRNPVMVVHGLLGSAENFILIGPKKSLTFILANNGYDVWLLNTRGSWHSRKHRTLDPDKDAEFWQFTLTEIGAYDIPASIKYVLKLTNRDTIHYIGLSQGTTDFFIMSSERPEYKKYIDVMIALAPSAFSLHFKQPLLRMITPFHGFLQQLTTDLDEHEMIPFISSANIRAVGRALCGKNHVLSHSTCHTIAIQLLDDEEMDEEAVPLAFSTIPSEASVKQALHYAQLIQSGKFGKYDWGREENIRRYNSEIPPDYNLKNVTTPVAIFYGEADPFTAKEDVEKLMKTLPNVIEFYKVPPKKWTHFDFMWGKNVDVLVYNKAVNIINKYDHNVPDGNL